MSRISRTYSGANIWFNEPRVGKSTSLSNPSLQRNQVKNNQKSRTPVLFYIIIWEQAWTSLWANQECSCFIFRLFLHSLSNFSCTSQFLRTIHAFHFTEGRLVIETVHGDRWKVNGKTGDAEQVISLSSSPRIELYFCSWHQCEQSFGFFISFWFTLHKPK